MALNGTCPSCGAKAPLEHFVIEARYKQALAAAFATPAALADLVLPYLALFAPASGRAIAAPKLARIVGEFAELTGAAQVTRNRNTHAAPAELWRAGLEATLAARDAGTLALPLDGHAYLAEIVWRLAAKAAAGGERPAPRVSHPSHRAFDDRGPPDIVCRRPGGAAERASLQRLIDASPDGAAKTALEQQLQRLQGSDK